MSFQVDDIVRGKLDGEIFLVTHITQRQIALLEGPRCDVISADGAFGLFNVPQDNLELVISAQDYDKRRMGARS
jgi:hypothetical protein